MWRKLLSLCVLLIVVSACGGGGGTAGSLLEAPSGATADNGNLPGLGSLGEPARQAQDVRHEFTDADLIASSGAMPIGPAFALEEAGLSFAVLGVELPADHTPVSLELDGTFNELYVAVCDYPNQRWRFLEGAHSAAGTITLPADGMTDAGYFYAALLAPDGHDASATLAVNLEGVDPDATWTVLLYMAADNDLAQSAVDDLNELEAAGSVENVTLLAGYDIDPAWVSDDVSGIDTVNYIRIVEDTDPLAINTTGDPANHSEPRAGYNSANPENLDAFLDWAETNFPATDHTVLILWDHGDGWRRSSSVRGTSAAKAASGLFSDESDSSGNLTDNQNIAASLSTRHFDILAFDACNMGHIESLYDYRGLADYYLASEVLVPTDGYPYGQILSNWQSTGPFSVKMLAESFVDLNRSYYAGQGEYVTHAVYQDRHMSALVSDLRLLADAVILTAGAEGENVRSAISASFAPEAGDGVRDLGQFLDALQTNSDNGAIDALAADARGSLDQFIHHFRQYNQPATTGLGAYLPDYEWFTSEVKDEYRPLAFNTATRWLEMLEATGVPGVIVPTDVTWLETWRAEITWTGSSDLVLDPIITSPDGDSGYPGNGGDLAGVVAFSDDSSVSGDTLENATLLTGAPVGNYTLNIDYDDPAGPDELQVEIRIYNGEGLLQNDLGVFAIPNATTQHVANLAFNDGGEMPELNWDTGYVLEIDWDNAQPERLIDLVIEDPEGNYGTPASPGGLSGTIAFSQDNGDSGAAFESATLEAGAPEGEYLFSLAYDTGDTAGPDSISINSVLKDDGGAVVHDFGATLISKGDPVNMALITKGSGTWVPGDYVMISWPSIDADFDIEVLDPENNWGTTWDPSELEGRVAFSEDSIVSGVPEETAELLSGGVAGQYSIDVTYYQWEGIDPPPTNMTVTVELYDSTDTLKQTFDPLVFDMSEEMEDSTYEAAILTY